MSKMRRVLLWGVLSFALLVSAACSPAAAPVEEEAPETPIAEEVSASEAQAEETGGEEVEVAEASPASETSAPEDFPIMEGYYKLQVMRNGAVVNYQVDGAIADVVAFYTEQLPNYGWEEAGPPDTAVGSIATMLRRNEAGDQLSISMQENKLGGFIRVTLTVNRAP